MSFSKDLQWALFSFYERESEICLGLGQVGLVGLVGLVMLGTLHCL